MDTLYIPCGWPQGVCTGSAGVPEGTDPDIVEAAEEEAAFTLWTLTGMRYGQCEVTVSLAPECRCTGRCTCRRCVLHLPGPVGDVSEVLVDSVSVTDWEQHGDTLVRTTGWPTAGVTVTYLRGRPVPPGGERSVRLLATQLVRSWCPSGDCQPPSNLARRTRRGDTLEFNTDRPESRLTGLPFVDSWIAAANRAASPPSVWSPDTDRWVYDSGPTPA